MKKKVNIVGKIDGYTGIARHTVAFIRTLRDAYDCNFLDTRPNESDLRALPSGTLALQTYDRAATEALVSVFTDVTSNNAHDYNWQKVPITQRKYIYSVFDSTKIPSEWVDIINVHFDAVFVPSFFLVGIYRTCGVRKPIFHLPLAIDIGPFLAFPDPIVTNDDSYVFGFIGSRERRKNLEFLIHCFISAFGNSTCVSLRLHCALDFENDVEFFETLRQRATNIEITHGALNADDYLALVASIDCFVSYSLGEGYSIVPREFLAAGKPVILTDSFAHAEILKDLRLIGDNLAFGVDADIPTHAHCPHVYDGGPFGIQFEPILLSGIQALKDCYTQRHSLSDSDLVTKRRSWAQAYDISALTPLYRSIIEPAFARKTTGDALEFGGISTTDANLLSRITGRNYSAGFTDNLRQKPEKLVVIGNDGGFFSLFNRFISYLTWTLTENPESVVLPDWRVAAMQKYWGKKTFTSFCYGTHADGNIWLKLFEPLPYANITLDTYEKTSDLYEYASIRDDFNEEKEPWLTYIHAYKLYKSPNFPRWRHWYNLHLSAYVRLRPEIQSRIDAIHETYLRGYTVISAHIRHPSHGIEQPGSRLPTVELFCERIRAIMNEHSLNLDSTRVFLATDQSSVVDEVVGAFGALVVYSGDAQRTTLAQDAAFAQLSDAEKLVEGFQVQHVAASNPDNWSTTMAEDVLIDTYLLAKGHHFVHITSNIATAVAYINPRIQMHYCE